MRKTTLIVASVLASAAVAPVYAGSFTKGVKQETEVTVKQGKKTAEVSIALAKGNYKIAAAAGTVKAEDGTTTLVNDGFTLDKEKTIKVTVTLDANAAADTKVKVTTTVSDETVDAASKTYADKLVQEAVNKATDAEYKADPTLKDLAIESSALSEKINALTWAQVQEYQKSGKIAEFDGQINQLSSAVEAAAKNYRQYKYASGKVNDEDLNSALEALVTLHGNSEGGLNDENEASYNELVDEINAYKDQVEADYKAGDCGAAAYNKTTVDAKFEAWNTKIQALTEALESGDNALATWKLINSAVVDRIGVLQGQIDEYYKFLTGAVDDGETYGYFNETIAKKAEVNGEDHSVYEDTYAKDLIELQKSIYDLKTQVKDKNLKPNPDPVEGSISKTDADNTIQQISLDFSGKLSTMQNNVIDQRHAYDAAMTNVKAKKDEIQAVKDVLVADSDTKTYYASAVKAIDDAIAALEATVKADNKAHTITEADYSEALAAIDIATLAAKVANSNAEEAAHDANIATLNGLKNTLKGYKDAIKVLKSTEKYKGAEYTIGTRYDEYVAAIETAIQTLIDEVNSEDNYTVLKNGAYNNGNVTVAQNYVLTTTEIETKSGIYNDHATALVPMANGYYTSLKELKSEIDKLNATIAANTNVTYGDATYGAYAEGVAAAYNSYTEEFDAILLLNGEDHYDAMVAWATSDAAINTLKGQVVAAKEAYAAAKLAYEQAQLNEACISLLNQAKAKVVDVDDSHNYTYAVYGKRAVTDVDAENLSLENMRAALFAEANGKITTAETAATANGGNYKQADLEILQAVVADLDKTNAEGKYAKLLKLAGECKTAYTAEKEIQTKLVNAAKKIYKDINGEGTYKSINALNQDPNKVDDIAGEVATLQAKLNAYWNKASKTVNINGTSYEDGKINESFLAETLKKDNVTTKDPAYTGHEDALEAIQEEVTKLRTLAQGYTDNYNAYQEIVKKLNGTTKVTADNKTYAQVIEAAKAAANTYATDEAKEYYLNTVIKAEENEKTAIETANLASYNDIKSVADKAVYNTRIKNSVDKLLALIGANGAIKANEDAHNAQLVSYESAMDEWKKLNAKIAEKEAVNDNHYTDAQKKGWNDQLTEYKKTIEKYAEDTKAAWAEGEATKDAYNTDITEVVKKIGKLSSEFDGEYAQAVADDNKERKDAFDKAYKELTDSYAKHINEVAELSRLEIAKEFEDLLVDQTTGDNIYKYAEIIRGLNADANRTYNETIGTENLWDKESANEDKAKEYQEKVEDLAMAYIAAVNDKAIREYENTEVNYTGPSYKGSWDEYDNTVNTKMAGWDKSVIKAGVPTNEKLKAVDQILKKYQNAYIPTETEDKHTFATTWENIIKPALATIPALLEEGLDESAAAQWNVEKANFETLAAAEAEDIKGFCKVGADAGYYSEAYAGIVAAVNAAIAEKEESIQNVINYANYSTVLDTEDYQALGSFCHRKLVEVNVGTQDKPKNELHTPEYKAAYDLHKTYLDNDKAYDEHIAVIDALRADADAAIAYANKMLSRYDDDVVSKINDLDGYIDDYRRNVNSDHESGLSKGWNKDTGWAKDWQKGVKDRIALVKDEALKQENEKYIKSEIDDLQYDYDKASAQLIKGGEEVTTLLAKWKQAIADITSDNESIYLDNTEGKLKADGVTRDPANKATYEETQEKYLDLEVTIGKLKTEIKSYSDADDKKLDADKIQKLNDDLAAVSGIINATELVHNKVKELYGEEHEALVKKAKEIQQLIDDAEADLTILLDANNIAKDIVKLESDANVHKGKVRVEEAKWNASDNKYKALQAKNANCVQLLDKLMGIANDFQYKDPVADHAENKVVAYENAQRLALEAYNANVNALYEGDELYDADNVVIDFANEYYNNFEGDVNDHLYQFGFYNMDKTDDEVIDAINSININSSLLSTTDFTIFSNKKNAIWNARVYAYDYGSDSYNKQSVNKDIDGKDIKDNDGNIVYKKFPFFTLNAKNTEAYAQVMAKYAELLTAIDALKADIKEAEVLVGDVNNDGVRNINDYLPLAKIILGELPTPTGKEFKRADVKSDGEINVSDLAQLVNMISEDYKHHARTLIAADNSNDQVTVDVENDVLSIGINNDVNYVGMQMDITLPSGASVLTEELAARAQNHELMINNLGNNKYRVLVISGENEAFGGHEGALFNLGLNNFHGTVAIDNIIFTDANAHSYKFTVNGGATAINGVDAQQTVGEKIYSVGGQLMNGLKKGVNIVKGAAKTVKVIK